jgi:hypothetical protein
MQNRRNETGKITSGWGGVLLQNGLHFFQGLLRKLNAVFKPFLTRPVVAYHL